MDLQNTYETGKPHHKKKVMINHHLVAFIQTIQVSYEGFTGCILSSKISGVDTSFGQLVYVLLGPNKQRALKTNIFFELN
jgi:hypothetical protein